MSSARHEHADGTAAHPAAGEKRPARHRTDERLPAVRRPGAHYTVDATDDELQRWRIELPASASARLRHAVLRDLRAAMSAISTRSTSCCSACRGVADERYERPNVPCGARRRRPCSAHRCSEADVHVAILSARTGWHTDELLRALAERGHDGRIVLVRGARRQTSGESVQP